MYTLSYVSVAGPVLAHRGPATQEGRGTAASRVQGDGMDVVRAKRGTCLQRRGGVPSLSGNSGMFSITGPSAPAKPAPGRVLFLTARLAVPRWNIFSHGEAMWGDASCTIRRADAGSGVLRRLVHMLAFSPACIILVPLGGTSDPLFPALSGHPFLFGGPSCAI